MYSGISDWIDSTSTKEKEQHLLEFLNDFNRRTKENELIIDEHLFDEDNIPVSYPDMEALIIELEINSSDLENFVNDLE